VSSGLDAYCDTKGYGRLKVFLKKVCHVLGFKATSTFVAQMQMVHLMFRNVAAIVADQDVRVKSILDHVRDTSDYIGGCTERHRSLASRRASLLLLDLHGRNSGAIFGGQPDQNSVLVVVNSP
jgi:hypothetical protein